MERSNEKEMSLRQKLINIQGELKAPKTQINSFGKYNYRKAEDILEAAKPLCKKYGCGILIRDDVEQRGERIFVKATAMLFDDGSQCEAWAFAEIDQSKKGMDAAQVTGSSSSYARKIALGGLLAVDNNPDPDSYDVGEMLEHSSTMDELKAVWASLPVTAQGKFSKAFGKRRAELEKGGKA